MKDEICKALGENIKKYRKLNKLTQENLAEALGMEIKSLSLIETGKGFVSAKTLANLCNVLKIMPADLFEMALDKEQNYYENILHALNTIKNDKNKLRILNYLIKDLL